MLWCNDVERLGVEPIRMAAAGGQGAGSDTKQGAVRHFLWRGSRGVCVAP